MKKPRVKRATNDDSTMKDDSHIVIPVLADDDAVFDFRDGFHLAVDLGGADANAAGV